MPTYHLTRSVSFTEHYEIEAGSEQEAVDIIESGVVDPSWTNDNDDGEIDVDSIEQDETEDGCDECGTTPPELHASHCSAFGIPDESRPEQDR